MFMLYKYYMSVSNGSLVVATKLNVAKLFYYVQKINTFTKVTYVLRSSNYICM